MHTRAHTHREMGKKKNQQVNETAAVEQDCTTEEESKTQQGQREGQGRPLYITFVLNSVCNARFL